MRKILVTYTMHTADEIVKSKVELPVSKVAATSIKDAIKYNEKLPSYIMASIRDVVLNLAALQGYLAKAIIDVEIIG